MNFHRACVCVLGFFVCSLAYAVPAKDSGFYLGGALGVTELEDDGAFAGLNVDDSDSSIQITGGYKISPNFAFEGRVSNLGDYTISGMGTVTIGVDVVSVHAVGILPVGEDGFEFFGQLGFGRADLDTSCCGSDDETVGSAGIGVRYFASEHFAIGLQIDAYAYEDKSTGITYDMGVVTSQVSFQYLF